MNGFASMAYAAMLIGFARAIFVVLDQGRIIDSIVNGLVSPLQHLPLALCAVGMMVAQALIHIPVPSVSGQAVLTMPVMVPVSDVIGLSRQVTVLAYQYGAGLTELVTPTNGAMVAVAAAAGVKFGDWLAFPLRHAARYESLHPAFARAFAFLATTDLAALTAGRHDIDGDRSAVTRPVDVVCS